jgi:4-amino-4-deoxy-L-arabinose transferase-like glycosyltransferase
MGAGQHLCPGTKLEIGMTARLQTEETSSRLAADILLLAGFCGFLFFFGLSYFGLVGADEPRYAQVAREMLNRHDWITPTLGGKPWLEKPVLYYWQAIVAYGIFGVSDWGARLPSAFDATVMVFAVYIFLRRFRPGFQLDGALIAASSAGVVGFARAASTDMPLAAMFTIAMLAWYAWYESRSRSYLALFYLFLGLGVLAKGPVALLLAAVIIMLFTTLEHELGRLWQTLWIPGIAIFLTVVLPWYVAVQIRNPEFFQMFILEHNFARFGSSLYHHVQPFWYFVPVVILALLPWTVFVIAAVRQSIADWWPKRLGLESDAFSLFLLIWLVIPVAFFSISQSKLPGYILPAVPAGSLLVAEYVRKKCADAQSPHFWQVVLHSVVASSVLVPALMIHYVLLQHRIPWDRAALPLAFTGVCAIAITLMLNVSDLRLLRFATLIPAVLVVGVVLRVGAPSLDALLSARPLAEAIASLQPKLGAQFETMQVAVFETPRETEYGLAFYLNRNIARYERQQIPLADHLLIAPAGSQSVVASSVPGRRISYLGTFGPQGLDYFGVSKSSN